MIRSSKKRVIKVYQVRYELGKARRREERGEREAERLQLTPLGYGTNACSNGSLITNYYRGTPTQELLLDSEKTQTGFTEPFKSINITMQQENQSE